MEFNAWKVSGSFSYRIQIDGVELKTRKEVLNDFRDWSFAGEILPLANKNFGLIFLKDFESKEDFTKWFKKFPYPIRVYDLDGDKVLKEKTKNKSSKGGKRLNKKTKIVVSEKIKRGKSKCSLCGERGHKKPTCPQNKLKISVAKKVVAPERKKRICKCCGEKGHMAKCCPNLVNLNNSTNSK